MGKNGSARAPLAGRVVRPAKNGKSKVVRSSGKRWSDRCEKVFLETLAATCNVRLSAAEVGFTAAALYRRRARWPAFKAAWDAAIEHGYARIEALLVERATDSVVRVELDGDWEPAGPPLSNAEMMNLLKLHRSTARGGKEQNYDWRAKPWDMDAIRASILRKIEAIERARALGREQDGGDAAGSGGAGDGAEGSGWAGSGGESSGGEGSGGG
ncbi:MAG: hypothetical protein J0G94_09145 [Sphingomonadales bacterium]|nr:hypothetical protein [Sphingomonadales bacterium]